MNELNKIKEAEFFYDKMLSVDGGIDEYKYYLSAFLSAARSVLQYALMEAEHIPGGRNWYDLNVSKNPVLRFFKDKRNVNIHAQPVDFRKDVNIKITETIRVSESISIIKKDSEGNIIEEYHSKSKKSKPKIEIPPEITHKYWFDDWSGGEDIPTLCKKYLDDLNSFVERGQSDGFLSL